MVTSINTPAKLSDPSSPTGAPFLPSVSVTVTVLKTKQLQQTELLFLKNTNKQKANLWVLLNKQHKNQRSQFVYGHIFFIPGPCNSINLSLKARQHLRVRFLLSSEFISWVFSACVLFSSQLSCGSSLQMCFWQQVEDLRKRSSTLKHSLLHLFYKMTVRPPGLTTSYSFKSSRPTHLPLLPS